MPDTSTLRSGTLPAQKVDYQALKAWIAAQEAYEAETNQPAPLTAAQRKAVAELTRVNPNVLRQNIDIDYISILDRFLSATQSTGTTLLYSPATPVPSSSPSPLWTQSLTLTLPPPPPLTFPSPSPSPSARSHPGPQCFARKKDAKKYAAKLCVEHLLSTGHLVPDRVTTTSSSPDGVVVPGLGPVLPPSPSLAPRRRRSSGGGASSSSSSGAAAAAVDDDPNPLPATQRVEQLCRKLGFQAPAYRLFQLPSSPTSPPPAGVVSSAATGGMWDGEADFGGDAFRVPRNRVRWVGGAVGRRQARQAVARKCLDFLLEAEEERRRQGRMVLGDG